MKKLFFLITLCSLFTYGNLANAVIIGDVSSGGIFSGTVATDDGWITESAAGNGVNFWTLTADAGSLLSVNVSSFIDFGISVYRGEVSDNIGFAFDNNGDFVDPLSFELGTYIGGTNGDFGEFGSELFDLSLVDAGIYTIALGGDLGFGSFGPYDYRMTVDITSAVPDPAVLSLLLPGLLGLLILRRRKTEV